MKLGLERYSELWYRCFKKFKFWSYTSREILDAHPYLNPWRLKFSCTLNLLEICFSTLLYTQSLLGLCFSDFKYISIYWNHSRLWTINCWRFIRRNIARLSCKSRIRWSWRRWTTVKEGFFLKKAYDICVASIHITTIIYWIKMRSLALDIKGLG